MPAPSKFEGVRHSFDQSFQKARERVHRRKKNFLSRRPHRSFQRTRRRDARRSLQLPGYIAFTHHVNVQLAKSWKLFALLGVVYGIATVIFVGIGSQANYDLLVQALRDAGSEVVAGQIGQLGEAGILFASIAANGLSDGLTEAQQLYATLLFTLTWLTTVWLLRHRMAGHVVRLRDGLYNAGAPIVASILVLLVMVVQLLPLAIALIGYSAALSSGLLAGGVEAMLFWIAAGLLAGLTLYWVTSTFFALIIVTLPGTYPLQALRLAGDLVVSRRLRILLRFIWMFFVVALVWLLVVIPVILFDAWIKSVWPAIAGVPIVPSVLLFMSTATVIWSSAYVYVLYRKVVEDDALPA